MTDEEINDPANIPFLINGVLNDYSSAHTYVSLWADLLSDALVNDGKVQGSTDVRGEYLDNGSYDPTEGPTLLLTRRLQRFGDLRIH